MPKLPCQSGNPDRWFPTTGTTDKDIAKAKAECASCPILDDCKEWAVIHGEVGIWGATTESDRKSIRHHRRITAKPILMDVINEDRNAVVRGMVARGLNGPQIADALGISPSGAAQAINRAKRGKAS
jgi:WhiB family redox-sensing transcriptional regulator